MAHLLSAENSLTALLPLLCACQLPNPLREHYVSYLRHIQLFGGKQYEKPDNVKASMYVAMADLLAAEQLPVVALSVKARHQSLL